MKSSLFWIVTQRVVVKMGLKVYPETSISFFITTGCVTIQRRTKLRVPANLQMEKATLRGGDGWECIDLAAENTLQVRSRSLKVTTGTNGNVLFRTFFFKSLLNLDFFFFKKTL